MPITKGRDGGASLAVRDEFIFDNNTDRDDYFTVNPSKLKENINVVVSGKLQKYSNSNFVDISSVIQGGRGAAAQRLFFNILLMVQQDGLTP